MTRTPTTITSKASKTYDSIQAGNIIDTVIRELFLRHAVQTTVGPTPVHKHFTIGKTEQMVNYGVVAYPCDMASASRSVANDVYLSLGDSQQAVALHRMSLVTLLEAPTPPVWLPTAWQRS